jgi:dihydroorotate dehydrogenase (NAD+) catalytic subunit
MGLINSIGLANPGVKRFIAEKLPFLEGFPCTVIINVAGSTEAEYIETLESIEAALIESDSNIGGYEINVSCPNVAHGGMSFGTNPKVVESLTRSLRQKTSRTLIVKLSPNVTDIADIARAAEAGGADAVSCINTLVGMSIDTESCRPAIARGTGGLSGPAIRPIGVACVWKVSRALSIPVIGIGGISKTEDALEYLLAGASAIQVGTALFSDPKAPRAIIDGIGAWMQKKGIARVVDIPKLLLTNF